MTEIIEVLGQIKGKDFTVGLVLWDGKVIEAAPAIRYMRGWSRRRVREYCAKRKWQVTVVHEVRRPKPK